MWRTKKGRRKRLKKKQNRKNNRKVKKRKLWKLNLRNLLKLERNSSSPAYSRKINEVRSIRKVENERATGPDIVQARLPQFLK